MDAGLVIEDALSAASQVAKVLGDLLSPAKHVESWRMGNVRVAEAKLRLKTEKRKAGIQETLRDLDEEIERNSKLLELARLRKEIALQRAETFILLSAIAEAAPASGCALLEEFSGDYPWAALPRLSQKVITVRPLSAPEAATREDIDNPSQP